MNISNTSRFRLTLHKSEVVIHATGLSEELQHSLQSVVRVGSTDHKKQEEM